MKQNKFIEHCNNKLNKFVCNKKKQARLKAFECRRCSIKFYNNTKLHKHVEKHHVKKFKFEIFASIFISKKATTTFFNTFAQKISKLILSISILASIIVSKEMSITISKASIIFLIIFLQTISKSTLSILILISIYNLIKTSNNVSFTSFITSQQKINKLVITLEFSRLFKLIFVSFTFSFISSKTLIILHQKHHMQ